MASDGNVLEAQLAIPYQFQDRSFLRTALTAGDSNSDDRDGHRRMAQVGDTLISFVIMSEGFDRDIPRAQLQSINSQFRSKEMCSMLARKNRFDQMIRISERQEHIGPQPTTLKNTLAAIVAAVWQDSRDYRSVVEVMVSLGLVNYAGSSINEHSLPSMSSPPLSATGNENLDECSGELEAIMRDVNFDTLLDIDMLGPEWTSTESHIDLPSGWFAVDSLYNLNAESGVAQLAIDREAEERGYEGQLAQENPRTAVNPSTLDTGYGIEQPTTNDSHPAPTSYARADIDSMDGNGVVGRVDSISPDVSQARKRRKAGLGSSRRKNGTKSQTLKTRSSVHAIFAAYITREGGKLEHRPELFTRHYGHMKSYQEALSSIQTTHHNVLASMAVAIGDCSAMLLLKKAIESVRCPPTSGSLHVERDMSPEQRLMAIHHLDLCMAHLKLARWLHIYMLYEEISRTLGGKDADGFVVVTDAGLGHTASATPVLTQRGNPRNLEQASIAKRMMNHPSANNSRGRDRDRTMRSMKRLRRIGQRLQHMVRRWGLGILSLLGAGFTDDLMMKVTDTVFDQFVDVVDRFEGRNIYAVSNAAVRAVQLFMNDIITPPRLQIEVVEEDFLEQLPRLSQDIEALFIRTGDT